MLAVDIKGLDADHTGASDELLSRLLVASTEDIPICISQIYTPKVIMGAIYCETEYGLVWHVVLILDPCGIK